MTTEWYIILGLLLFIVIIGTYLLVKKRQLQKRFLDEVLSDKKEIIRQETDEEIAKQKDRLKIELAHSEAEARTYMAHIRHERDQAIFEYQSLIQHQSEMVRQKQADCEQIIEQLEQRKKDLEEAYQQSVADEKRRKEKELLDWETLRIFKLNQEYDKHKQELITKTNEETQTYISQCEEKKMQYTADLKIIEEQLEEYKKKRQVINEEILRQRAIEEQQDFYRIILPSAAVDDIQLLLSVRENLKQRENLDKLIYEAYISKPTQEMIKRVLEGRAPSGIYKITRLKTGEIYIGKSTDIKKRWGEHSKTAYGVGTIAHSTLHTTIKKDGIQNFTFELLEEVPKDKLTEREKYWITFYDSKSYGLNERNG